MIPSFVFDLKDGCVKLSALVGEQNAMTAFDRKPPAEARPCVHLGNLRVCLIAGSNECANCVEFRYATLHELKLPQPLAFVVGHVRT